ncbi:MAG: Hpt domain-containing protein [Negativicutes bacterium]|nr:Hpt domain-containing protein [Negativicutes bacterium]
MSYDPRQVVEEMGLDPDDMKEIFDDYFREVKTVLDQIGPAVDAGDAAQLKALLHNVKGSSGNLQMQEVYELAAKLEKAAIAGDLATVAAEHPVLAAKIAENRRLVVQYYD